MSEALGTLGAALDPGAARVADVAVVGAGAAGLMAAIAAGREGARVVALDGARTLGAKILVAGGGRCNVTHWRVDESAYAGSSRAAVRKVLGRFDVERTVGFFREQGVELKREETGKLFPVSDRARTVLDALLAAARSAGVVIAHPWRVERVRRESDGSFVVERAGGESGGVGVGGEVDELVRARRVVLATGGMALPKSGSDGQGYGIARSLGHTTTGRIFPALVPITLGEDPAGRMVRGLSGVAVSATVEVREGGGGGVVASFTNSVLCTHFGLSGPGVLDVSRYWLDARARALESRRAMPELRVNWLAGTTPAELDRELIDRGRHSAGRVLGERLPERLARALCELAGVDPAGPLHGLRREQRAALVSAATGLRLEPTGDRGFAHAEVTAGGVPLSEVRLETMESRVCPGLHLCGEILDVDGRIGGFNFQWAWASGHVAGSASGRSARAEQADPAGSG